MSFRCRQTYVASPSYVVAEAREKEMENGLLVSEIVDTSKEKMPDPELFRLRNIIEAGVAPQEVNSKIISVGSVNYDSFVRKYTKSEGNKSEEVNNNGN